MSEQAAKLAVLCSSCGSPCDGWAVQLVRDSRLCWEFAWECAACGTASDDGGWGWVQVEWREELLAQHGSYLLRLQDDESRGGPVLKVFRQVLDCSLRDAVEFAGRLRQAGYEGTLIETELLRDRLRQAGILSVVIPSR